MGKHVPRAVFVEFELLGLISRVTKAESQTSVINWLRGRCVEEHRRIGCQCWRDHEDEAGRALELCCSNSSVCPVYKRDNRQVVVACTLAERRKAASQEVKNFHLCLCLLSNTFVVLMEQRFSLVTFSPCANVHLDGLHVEVMICNTFQVCVSVCLQSLVSILQEWTRFVTDLSCSQLVEKRAYAWLKDLEDSTPCLGRKPFASEKSDHPRFVCPIQLPARIVVTSIPA